MRVPSVFLLFQEHISKTKAEVGVVMVLREALMSQASRRRGLHEQDGRGVNDINALQVRCGHAVWRGVCAVARLACLLRRWQSLFQCDRARCAAGSRFFSRTMCSRGPALCL